MKIETLGDAMNVHKAKWQDSHEGYHSFKNEEGESFGSFIISWHDGVPAYVSSCECGGCAECDEMNREIGWYWIAQFPGCMPDGDFPNGPYESSEHAYDIAQEME